MATRSSRARAHRQPAGPLLDRIDIDVEVPGMAHQKLSDDQLGKVSALIRARVKAGANTAKATVWEDGKSQVMVKHLSSMR